MNGTCEAGQWNLEQEARTPIWSLLTLRHKLKKLLHLTDHFQ